MKQGTLKSLGTAAVGAAIAITAAGTASAAAGTPGTLESVATTVEVTSQKMPLEQVAKAAPGGTAVSAVNRVLGSGVLHNASKAVDNSLAPNLPQDSKGNSGLLGLLPTGFKGISMPGTGGGH
ncbi:ATP-binding protein [Streptomyces sp. NPDC049577]|uniref:ATP-binding protein n=1 Tax=Streptomyces sp. NPDC049577 TaxID=3155153 RepID=UPI003434ED81